MDAIRSSYYQRCEKSDNRKVIGRGIGYVGMFLCLSFIFVCKYVPGVGEWYSRYVYPTVASLLAAVSKYIPFSLYDLFILGVITYLFWLLVRMFGRRISLLKGCGRFVRLIVWLYIGFYFAWGINYYRDDFYQRNEIRPVQVDSTAYYRFAERYVDRLNRLASDSVSVPVDLAKQVRHGYRSLGRKFVLSAPWLMNTPKPILWSELMAKMGIKGYIGAYFNEPLVSSKLLDVEYPFTYAHEMAHVMGISSEAEANLLAFLVCTRASDSRLQYSGYASLLGYVLSNAARILPEEQFVRLRDKISPIARRHFIETRQHWAALYSEWLGKGQEWMYDRFLKGNRISSGVQNYSQAIGYLMALEAWEEGTRPYE